MKGLVTAIGFLTRLPVPVRELGPADAAAAMVWYPAVGAILAALVVAVHQGATTTWGAPVAGILAVITLAALTGGLHLDGLADCFDGMGVNGDREKRLQVMHDPRLGGLGTTGLVLGLLLKCALAGAVGWTGLLTALVLARAPVASQVLVVPPATPGRGLLGWMAAEVRPHHAVAAFALGFGLVAPVALAHPLRLLIAAGAAALLTFAWDSFWRRTIGGITGDVLGAAIELREIVILAVFAAL